MGDSTNVPAKEPGFWHKVGSKLVDIGLTTLGTYLQGLGAFGGGR